MAVNGILLGQDKQFNNNLDFSFYSNITFNNTQSVSVDLVSGYIYKLFYLSSQTETNNYSYRIGIDGLNRYTTTIKHELSNVASGSNLIIPSSSTSVGSSSLYNFLGPEYYGNNNIAPLYVFIYYPNQKESYYQWKIYIKYQNLTEEIITGTSFSSLSLKASNRIIPNNPTTIAKIYRNLLN